MSSDYRQDRTYGAFLHRELSVSWLVLALRLAGRHQLDLNHGRFTLLELGCGHGLNLLFNAAAHPEAQFYGVDLHPSHVAQARQRAKDLGLTNVQFAQADLRDFASGSPDSWPQEHDLVVAHGVASWVSAGTRAALLQAAARQLRPGGVFYCSYNTYPGWLERSPLQMLALELGLQEGGNTTQASLQQASRWLEALLGGVDDPPPLGRHLPELRPYLARLAQSPPSYLEGEFQATHQPLYVGAMQRDCTRCGLMPIGTATLPELFPEMLDPRRRQLLEEAPEPPLREVLLDLLIHQSFRRDLYAKGVVPPVPALWQAELAALPVLLRREGLASRQSVDCSLGGMALDPALMAAIEQVLQPGACRLGELADQVGLGCRELLPLLALLLHADQVGVVVAADCGGASTAAVGAFNQRLRERAAVNAGLGGWLAPALLLPLPLTDLQILLAQSEDMALEPAERLALVWMGMQMAGLSVESDSGEPLLQEPAALERLAQLRQALESSGTLAELQRLREPGGWS